jgi:E3 ubiquitin-protein ligase SspH2
LQALSEWEGRGGTGEYRTDVAVRIRAYLENLALDEFLPLNGLNLRLHELPPLPDAPRLNLNGNLLTELPVLPKGVEWLCCDGNPLRDIPALPAGLKGLTLNSVPLSRLPTLPDTLIELEAAQCGLTTLPESLPPGLIVLLLNDNHLTHVPALPRALHTCDLSNNRLTDLPENYSALNRYGTIHLYDNPLSEELRQSIRALRHDPAYQGPYIGLDPLPPSRDSDSDSDDEEMNAQFRRPLPMAVGSWYAADRRDAVQVPWQAFLQEPQAEGFSRFLDRLALGVQATAPAVRDSFRATVATWLDRLANDAELRADTFAFADRAGNTCADRAALSFLQMMRLRTVRDVTAGRYDQAPAHLLGVAKSIRRQEALERLAQERVAAHPTREEIEVYLAFLTQRSERLALSLDLSEMNFLQEAQVTEQELDQAAAAVEALDTTFPHFLSNWEPWRSVLQRWDPDRFEAAQDRLYDSLDNGDFEAHARTQGFVGPAATQALYHDVFGPLTQAYLKDHDLSL